MFQYYGNIHNIYKAPGQAQITPRGQNFSININFLSICLFPVIFTHLIAFYHFSPFKCIGDLSWPCRKIGQGHRRVMIYINYEGIASPMLHSKFCENWPTGSEEEDFFKGFCYL